MCTKKTWLARVGENRKKLLQTPYVGDSCRRSTIGISHLPTAYLVIYMITFVGRPYKVCIFANWCLSHFMSMLSRTLCRFFRPSFFSSQGFPLFSWISWVWMESYSVEWNISINDKTAKTQNDLRFPLFRTDKPSFFRGLNEEPQSRYNSNSMDDLQLVS